MMHNLSGYQKRLKKFANQAAEVVKFVTSKRVTGATHWNCSVAAVFVQVIASLCVTLLF